jgi:uncharacterized membrane-anchored protein YhcB (DUF1043 family)
MRNLITFFLLFVSLTAFSQTLDSIAVRQLQQTVIQLQEDFSNQKKNWKNQSDDFMNKLSKATDSIALLRAEIKTGRAKIVAIADSLNIKITKTEQNANTQISNVEIRRTTSLRYIIFGGIVLLLLLLALFVWLYCRQKSNRRDIIGQLEKSKSSIDEKLVTEFAKGTEIMDSLLKTLRELPASAATGAPDHSLALKLADEITLMERNISLMDTGTKGLKQLTRSIGKLKDNLAANGYEIPELLGKAYNEGMKAIITNTVQDDNLEQGIELITKIVKPQVNYQDKMIQSAQIEVSVG